jgi:hypothetical protein
MGPKIRVLLPTVQVLIAAALITVNANRKGQVVALATEGDEHVRKVMDHVLTVPPSSDLLSPILDMCAAAVARVPHRRPPWLRCGSATESGQELTVE